MAQIRNKQEIPFTPMIDVDMKNTIFLICALHLERGSLNSEVVMNLIFVLIKRKHFQIKQFINQNFQKEQNVNFPEILFSL